MKIDRNSEEWKSARQIASKKVRVLLVEYSDIENNIAEIHQAALAEAFAIALGSYCNMSPENIDIAMNALKNSMTMKTKRESDKFYRNSEF